MNGADDVVVSSELRVPRSELTIRASRSGGPGGQHVNTTASRVELTWNVAESPSLTEEQRARLQEKLATRLDGEGVLRLVASRRRSQHQNREAVLERFTEVVGAALKKPRPRRKTRPTAASREARLEEKKRRADRKRQRGRPPPED
jgi:ribosome-associated protein